MHIYRSFFGTWEPFLVFIGSTATKIFPILKYKDIFRDQETIHCQYFWEESSWFCYISGWPLWIKISRSMLTLNTYMKAFSSCLLLIIHVQCIKIIKIIIICLLYLFGHIHFLLSFKKKESLHRTILMQNIFTDQILLNSQKCSLKFFFLPLFLKSSNLILKSFTLLLFLIWLSNLFQKYFTLLAKKSNWLVDLFFEIYFDSKFLVWREILKKCLPQLEIPLIILKVSIRSPHFLLSSKVVNSNFSNLFL